MKRRFLSILLCLLLAVQLVPAPAAQAAGEGETQAAVALEAGGATLSGTAEAPAYATTDSGTGAVTLQDTFTESDDWNIRWDGQTLTLRDAVIHSAGAFGIALTIDNKRSDLVIELEGENQVSSQGDGSGGKMEGSYSCGVWIYADTTWAAGSTVTIRERGEGGSLTATGGSVTSGNGGSGLGYSAGIGVALPNIDRNISDYGIYLTLESGTVTARGGTEGNNEGGNATISAGIYLYNSAFTITGGSADLAGGSTAEAGSPCYIGAGIYAGGESTSCIKAGALTASGKNGETYNYGICNMGDKLVVDLAGGKAEISGTTYGIGAYPWASDSAIISVTMTGGDMTLEGGESVCYKTQTQISPAFGYRIEALSGASEGDATTVDGSPFMEESPVDFSGVQYVHLSAQELSRPAIVNAADFNIPAGIVGTTYTSDQSLSVQEGEGPYTFSLKPLVDGLSIDENNHLVYVRPETPVEAQTVTITVTDANNMTGTATITVGAVEAQRYQVTVNNGQVLNGPGPYKGGDTVEIQSTPSAGTRFHHWESEPADVSFAGADEDPTTFIMPAHDVTVTAVLENQITVTYENIDGNGYTGEVKQFRGSYKLEGADEPDDMLFLGWAMGSQDGKVYQPGETVELTEDTTFYGQWARKENCMLVGGQLLHSSGQPVYATTDSVTGAVTLEDTFTDYDAWNIKWDGQTLTLRDATIKGVVADGALLGIQDYGSGHTIQNEGTTLIQMDGVSNISSFAIINLGGELTLKNTGTLSIQCDGTGTENCWMHGIYCAPDGMSGYWSSDLNVVNDGIIELSVRCPAIDSAENNVNTAIYVEEGNLTWSGSGTATVSANMLGDVPYYTGIWVKDYMIMESGTLSVTADGNAIDIYSGDLVVNDGTLTVKGGVEGAGSGIESPEIYFDGGTITASTLGSDAYEDGFGIDGSSIHISSKATVTAQASGSGKSALDGMVYIRPKVGDATFLYAGADEESAELLEGMPIQGQENTLVSYPWGSVRYFHSQAEQVLFPYQANYRLQGQDYDGLYWSSWAEDLEIGGVRWGSEYVDDEVVNYGSSILVPRELLDREGSNSLELNIMFENYAPCDISFPTDTGSGMLFFCQAAVDEKTAITQVKIDGTALDAGDYAVEGSALVIFKECLDELDVGAHTVTCVLADGESYKSLLTIPQTYTLTVSTSDEASCWVSINNHEVKLTSPQTWPVVAGDRVELCLLYVGDGYRFVHWSENGQVVSEDWYYEVVIEDRDVNLVAVCEPDIANRVIVGGEVMVSDGEPIYATTNAQGEVTLQPDYTEADNWNIKFEIGTLTLRDAIIHGVSGSNYGAGIYCPSNLTILLEGENVVTGADDAYESYGILCESELVLEGDGTARLTVSGGQSEEYSNGIYTWTYITISDCTVEAVGGTPSDGAEVDSFDSAAIDCGDEMTLDNCTVIATAGTAGSRGIGVDGVVYILGTHDRPFVVKVGADAVSAIEVEGSPFAEEKNLWNIPEVYDYDCGYISIAVHTHVYGDWEYNNTQHWKACECGDTIETAAHTASSWITVTEATATATGLRHKVCTVCGYEMERETIPATGSSHTHVYGDWEWDEGRHWKACDCGYIIETAAHTAGGWITETEATATTPGVRYRVCTVCGYEMERETIPATGSSHTHVYGDWAYDGTRHWKACECGQTIDSAAHTASSWITVTPATETAEGLRHKVCTVCGYEMERETIPAIGSSHTHTYGDWQYNGTQHWKACSCGEKSQVAAHTASSWITVTQATATAAGLRHKVCTVCGYEMERETIPATGSSHIHVYGDWEYDETRHWKACDCGYTVETAAHTAGGWITVTEATETTPGLRHRVCTVCGYELETQVIPAIVVIRGVDADGIQLSLSNGAAGTCLAALYDSDGRLLTAVSLEVAVGAGDLSLSFPAFAGKPATVKVFFLDEDYAPIYRSVTEKL